MKHFKVEYLKDFDDKQSKRISYIMADGYERIRLTQIEECVYFYRERSQDQPGRRHAVACFLWYHILSITEESDTLTVGPEADSLPLIEPWIKRAAPDHEHKNSDIGFYGSSPLFGSLVWPDFNKIFSGIRDPISKPFEPAENAQRTAEDHLRLSNGQGAQHESGVALEKAKAKEDEEFIAWFNGKRK